MLEYPVGVLTRTGQALVIAGPAAIVQKGVDADGGRVGGIADRQMSGVPTQPSIQVVEIVDGEAVKIGGDRVTVGVVVVGADAVVPHIGKQEFHHLGNKLGIGNSGGDFGNSGLGRDRPQKQDNQESDCSQPRCHSAAPIPVLDPFRDSVKFSNPVYNCTLFKRGKSNRPEKGSKRRYIAGRIRPE